MPSFSSRSAACPQPDRVAAIGTRVTFATFGGICASSVRRARRRRGVAAGRRAAAYSGRRTATGCVQAVSDEYFAVLGVSPWRGRFFDVEQQRMRVAHPLTLSWTSSLARYPRQQSAGHRSDHPDPVRPRPFAASRRERSRLQARTAAVWMPLGCCPRCAEQRPDGTTPANPAGACSAGSLTAIGSTGRRRTGRAFGARTAPLLHRASEGRPRRRTIASTVSAEKRIEFLLVVVLPRVVVALILWRGCSNIPNLLLAHAARGARKSPSGWRTAPDGCA